MFRNILVPYDGSKPAIRAFKVAMDMAQRNKSKLKVICLIGNADVGAWYVDVKLNKEVMRKAKDFTEKYLAELVNMAAKKDIAISSDILETNSMVKTLLSFAKTKKIDLIVMGSSGKGKFDRFLLGSTSNGVVQKASCPVLIIK